MSRHQAERHHHCAQVGAEPQRQGDRPTVGAARRPREGHRLLCGRSGRDCRESVSKWCQAGQADQLRSRRRSTTRPCAHGDRANVWRRDPHAHRATQLQGKIFARLQVSSERQRSAQEPTVRTSMQLFLYAFH